MFRLLFALLILLVAPQQQTNKPFILPIATPPNPAEWLFGQAYGNTTGAYNFGTEWYEAGQGLHFGLDFPMPCGTPLIAIGDGIIDSVDNLSRGAGPHNLLIYHPEQNLVTLYGHLLEVSEFAPGEAVTQGQIIGYSGDPEGTCDSRPHLHLEIRSRDYFTAYNPIDYIDANWHSLVMVSGYGSGLFQQDADNPRRWMTLEDQPLTRFGGIRLNDYAMGYPLSYDLQAPDNPPLAREAIPVDTNWSIRRIGFDQCCWVHWWDTVDTDRFYVIDGTAGQRASVQAWSAASGQLETVISAAPPAVTSPDGRYQIYNNHGYIRIVDSSNGEEWTTPLLGATPAMNPANTHLTWTTSTGSSVPGQGRPITSIWLSDITGYGTRQIFSDRGSSAQWLDANRLLIRQNSGHEDVLLHVYDIRDDSLYTLGTWKNLVQLEIAPGGGAIMFYLLWQGEPSGVYVISTQEGAQAQKLPWFGAYQWRDAESVYYIPLDVTTPYQTLAYYNIATGEDRVLITPDDIAFTIMNGDWEVSADGRRIIFQNEVDWNMWLLEATP